MPASRPKITVVDGHRGSPLLKVRLPEEGLTVGELRELVERTRNSTGLLQFDGDDVPDRLKLTAEDTDAVVRFYPDAQSNRGMVALTEFGDNSTAPSSYTYEQTTAKQTAAAGPEFLHFMPSTAVPDLPLPLAHPAFGRFLDRFYGGLELSKDDTRMYNKLSTVCSMFYPSDSEYVKAAVEAWTDYSGSMFVSREMATGESVCFLEGKRGISGNHSEPGMQLTKNYALFWLDASDLRERLRDTCYPAVLLEHVGPHVRVSAVVTLSRICVQPLTPFISFLELQNHDAIAASQGVRFCRAVKSLIEDLQAEYKDLAKKLEGDEDNEEVDDEEEDDDGLDSAEDEGKVDVDGRALYRAGIPYSLHALVEHVEGVRQLQPRVFCMQGMIVKYVQQEYGEAVHRAWSAAGFAPNLIAVEHLPGGWLEVFIEKLGDEWIRLSDHPTADQIRPKVLEVLERAHGVALRMDEQGNPTHGVHGDMRDANVMVKGDAEEVKFIDFDWAKEEGNLYPPFMNHTDINWPLGAEDYKPMLQRHDKELLSMAQDMQVKYKARARCLRRKAVRKGKAKLKALRDQLQ